MMFDWQEIPGNHTAWWEDLRVGDEVTVHLGHALPVEHTVTGRVASIERTYDAQGLADGPWKDITLGSSQNQYPLGIPRQFNPQQAHITRLRRFQGAQS